MRMGCKVEAKENSHTFVRLFCLNVTLNSVLMVDCKALSVFGFLLLHFPKEHLILTEQFGTWKNPAV